MGKLRSVVSALALSVVVGCGGEAPGWTVFVYMVADNNLEPFAVADLLEMADATDDANVRFVVQADRAQGYSAAPVGEMGDWTTTRRLVVRNGGFEPIEDLGELNMGLPGTLADFLRWGITTYPADRHALIFWDHGSGWPGFGGDDANNHDLLTLAELNTGIQSGLTGTNVAKLDLVGFDACLMATYEVAMTMKPYADYLLASEELEPGTGWDYRSFSVLGEGGAVTPVQLGTAVIDGFIAHSNSVNQGQDATLSLTDLGAPLDAVTTALSSFVSSANAGIQTGGQAVPTNIAQQRGVSVRFGDMPDPSQSMNAVDLGHLVANLGASDGARFASVSSQVQSALAGAVVYKRAGPLRSDATGLSIYFPPSAGYYKAADYSVVAAAAGWRSFLNTYYAAAGGTYGAITSPQFADGDPFVGFPFLDGYTWFYIENELEAGSAPAIARATLTYGVPSGEGNQYVLLGDKAAFWDHAEAWAYWNRSVMAVQQGEDRGYIYLSSYDTPSGGSAITLPFAYFPSQSAPAQYAVRQIVFSAAGAVIEDKYYLESPGGWGQLAPVVGSKLYPLLQTWDATGVNWAYGSTAGFDATRLASLEFGAYSFASGVELLGILAVEDFGGLGDAVVGTGANP